MGRRRIMRLMAAFLLVAGSSLIALGAPAGAGDLADSGWWYVRPGLTGQPGALRREQASVDRLIYAEHGEIIGRSRRPEGASPQET